MFIVGLLGWWYGAGWRERLRIIGERLARIADFFSIDLLATTLFAPFRQIGTEGRGKGIGEAFQAFTDQLVSRIIGSIVRAMMIIIGVVLLLVMSIVGLLEAIMWALAPLFPVAGAILFAVGWVPHDWL